MNHQAEAVSSGRLAHFPVSFFSMVMGVSGLAIAWQKAHLALGVSEWVWRLIAAFGTAVFAGLLLIYGVKIVRHFPAVAAEWKHPVRVSFFPTISISLLLLAVVWLPQFRAVAFFTWVLGAALHLVFTITILSSWMYHTHYDIKHANPAWFIPVVGNFFVPIAAVQFGLNEIGWFFFSIGLVFWGVLMTIVLYRIFFHDPIPTRLLPTLFILIAPPSVGFIAYSGLVPVIDVPARVLFYTGLFMTLLLGSNTLRFINAGFFLSAWAYSFPLAAITIACFLMAKQTGLVFFKGLATGLLVILTMVVIVLIVKTVGAIRRNAICVPE